MIEITGWIKDRFSILVLTNRERHARAVKFQLPRRGGGGERKGRRRRRRRV